ncbi:hypothetical protein ABTM35_19505, partial [Acinetobacter baumannii]
MRRRGHGLPQKDRKSRANSCAVAPRKHTRSKAYLISYWLHRLALVQQMKKRNPWVYVPTLYFAEGLPYTVVMMMSAV